MRSQTGTMEDPWTIWSNKENHYHYSEALWGEQQCGQSRRGHEQLVPGLCSTRLHPVATAVCNNNRLGTQEYRKKCRWNHVDRDVHLCDLDFADDIALVDDSWSKMQLNTSVLQEEASKVGLLLNPDKCKVMTTSAWNDWSDIQVELVSDFCYLGSYISFHGNCEKDVKVRIGKAATVFEKMKKIWRNNKISSEVRTWLYESIILSTLL